MRVRRVHAFSAQHPEGAFARVARDVGACFVDVAYSFTDAFVKRGLFGYQKFILRDVPNVVFDFRNAVFAAGNTATRTHYAFGVTRDGCKFSGKTLIARAGS